ncbi:DUF2267 domain-containing protein [Pseudonocardia sp. RS010]|uniref:DUF2267 domain-containing protein n=1 Tax=Pseudonocardia sp. RS010 TaxID=3385979 RepID=UPI00399F2E8E
MIAYQELVEGVCTRAGLDDAHEAREVAGAVLGTLVRAAPEAERPDLFAALPGPVEEQFVEPVPTAPATAQEVLGEVGRLLHEPPERSRYLTQAVLSALREQDAGFVERLESLLPGDTVAGLRRAGDPPQVTETRSPERPTALTADEVAAALRRLTMWTGDVHALCRTVAVPDEQVTPLIGSVEKAARERNDHVHAERVTDGVQFVVRTGRDRVTEADVAMAERIDEVVAEFGSA